MPPNNVYIDSKGNDMHKIFDYMNASLNIQLLPLS